MSALQGFRQNLDQNPRRYLWMALGLNAFVGLILLIFVLLAIWPSLRDMGLLSLEMEVTQQALAEAERASAATPEELQAELEAAKNAVAQLGALFFSATQATEIAQSLYTYAAETGIELVSLDTDAAASPAGTNTYQIHTVHVQARGPIGQLLLFLTRIQVANQPAAQFESLAIPTADEEPHELTLDLLLYTSPYAAFGGSLPAPSGPPTAPDTTPESITQLKADLDAAWEAQDWPQVLVVLPKLLNYSPDDAELLDKLYAARVNYGYQLLSQGQEQQAATQFLLALEIKPNGAEALDALQKLSRAPEVPAEPRPLAVVTPTTLPATAPTAISPTRNPYLVKPDKWPTGWPWPPDQRR
ncbi:MAG: hypothetical protein H5T69_04955 [Chloroflexi bacterium]|nr:hypothetical protein [Chloroflexota bacterium]